MLHVGCTAVGVARLKISRGSKTIAPMLFVRFALTHGECSAPYHPLMMLPAVPKSIETITRAIPKIESTVNGLCEAIRKVDATPKSIGMYINLGTVCFPVILFAASATIGAAAAMTVARVTLTVESPKTKVTTEKNSKSAAS